MARPRRASQVMGQKVNQLEFGTNLPCFRMFQFGISTQAVDNVETAVTFDVWENGNENVFAPNFIGSPPVIDYVSVLMEGVYSVTWSLEFDNNLTTGDFVGLAVQECAGCWTESPAVSYNGVPLAGDGATGHYMMHFIRGYPPIWLHMGAATCANAPCTPEFRFMVNQVSGSDQDTAFAYAEIYLLGGTSVDTSELGP